MVGGKTPFFVPMLIFWVLVSAQLLWRAKAQSRGLQQNTYNAYATASGFDNDFINAVYQVFNNRPKQVPQSAGYYSSYSSPVTEDKFKLFLDPAELFNSESRRRASAFLNIPPTLYMPLPQSSGTSQPDNQYFGVGWKPSGGLEGMLQDLTSRTSSLLSGTSSLNLKGSGNRLEALKRALKDNSPLIAQMRDTVRNLWGDTRAEAYGEDSGYLNDFPGENYDDQRSEQMNRRRRYAQDNDGFYDEYADAAERKETLRMFGQGLANVAEPLQKFLDQKNQENYSPRRAAAADVLDLMGKLGEGMARRPEERESYQPEYYPAFRRTLLAQNPVSTLGPIKSSDTTHRRLLKGN